MMNKQHNLLAYALLSTGLGAILLFMGSTFYVVIELAFGMKNMYGEETSFSLQYFYDVFSNDVFIGSYLYSLKVSLLGALFSILISYPIALWLRKPILGKEVIVTVFRIPMLVPGLVAAFLFVNMISYHGILNETLVTLGIWDKPRTLQNDDFGWGVVILQMWKNIPFALILISGSINGLKNDWFDAATNLGSNSWQRFRYLVFPLSLTTVSVAFILIFIGAMGDFAFFTIAGPRNTYSIVKYMQITAYELDEWNLSAVMAMSIMFTSAAVSVLATSFAKFFSTNKSEVK
ncbi:ABC transporter permease subunit [Pasteurella skyensis]|uniref:ABC transporter permease subunit n=1 Tax=Phocoenobacter skyensis TaxID=97481 RepID=A0AAJ6NZS2_9PAST|nr:ABC transporter permease subunit [Pasteurella skyensis]MDP8161657.1 ABC transporter permease subunit [Pasteurella skyensis]MDP8171813.1 ABC transporter permease subunit [Pasteurella skyensis]MDP8176050.1 ABC transporter permease subunit [Pasteurella skyensis]MDP8178068.1 ABC transporter permease subunit [Pasteurella skyensis]MDP8182322.1 ABC transporter permease subunit [Pasteurella skyensis]